MMRGMIKDVSKCLMGLFYMAAGANHFLNPAIYVQIMPDYLPAPLLLVYVSGLCEAILGFLLLVPPFTRWAAWGLVVLLMAIFPANIHMALHPELTPQLPALALWIRLPLQGLLIGWAYGFTRPISPVEG